MVFDKNDIKFEQIYDMVIVMFIIDFMVLINNWCVLDVMMDCEIVVVVKVDGYGLGVDCVVCSFVNVGVCIFFVVVIEEVVLLC